MPEALVLRGGAALSEFRRSRLLQALQSVDEAVADVQATWLHVVLSAQPLSSDTRSRVAALLDDGLTVAAEPAGASVLWVMPRLGTVSPWSSKATEIARMCGRIFLVRAGMNYFFFNSISNCANHAEILSISSSDSGLAITFITSL